MKLDFDVMQDFIPVKSKNRPGTACSATYITIHNTGNSNKGANAKAHANYVKSKDAMDKPVSWHFTVDDTLAYQHLPVKEIGYHTGLNVGNAHSIGIEICMNSDGDLYRATYNAMQLAAKLCLDFNIPSSQIVQHNYWTGKHCPQMLRTGKPMDWVHFINNTDAIINSETVTEDKLYRVQVGAFHDKANAESMREKAIKAGFKDAFIKVD